MPTVATADRNTLRNLHPHYTKLGIAVFQPTAIVTGQVSGSPSDGAESITLTSISQTEAPGEHFALIAGSAAGLDDGGKTRVKSWSSPTAVVAANNIEWTTYPYVSILKVIEPLTIIPDLQNQLMDGTKGYSQENIKYHPLGRIGPPAVGITGQPVKFYSSSQAVAPGASITGHSWTFPSGSPSSSSSAGSAASPIEVTWSTATGQTPHYVSYVTTDSNGKTHTRYTPVWIFDSIEDAYTNLTLGSCQADFDSGGAQLSITVYDSQATGSDFVNDAMIVLFADDYYAGHKTSIGGNWNHRENIIFVGYIVTGSVEKDYKNSRVTFQAESITGKMKRLTSWPANLEDNGSPSNWDQLYNMTCDLAAFHLFTERSTIDHIADISLSGVTKRLKFIDMPESALYELVDNYCMKTIGARCLSDMQGQIRLEQDPQLMADADRPSTVTLALDLDDDAREQIDLGVEEHVTQVAQVDFISFAYDGVDATPFYSLAPGKQFEHGTIQKVDGIRADDQDESNTLSGMYLANLNNSFKEVHLKAFNYRIWDVTPQDWTTLTLDGTETNRGITWSAQRLLARQVSYSYNAEIGALWAEITFEKESTGPPGITGYYPSEVPAPPDPPLSRTALDTPDLVAFDRAIGCQIRGSWVIRNGSLTGADIQDGRGEVDPFWTTADKQNTKYKDSAILWKVDAGRVYRTINGGQSWENVSPSAERPTATLPNDFGDTPPPNFGDVDYQEISAWPTLDKSYVAGGHYNAGAADSPVFRAWMIKTAVDGRPSDSTWIVDQITEWYNAGGITDSMIDGAWVATGQRDDATAIQNVVSPGSNDLVATATPHLEYNRGWDHSAGNNYFTGPTPDANSSFFIACYESAPKNWFGVEDDVDSNDDFRAKTSGFSVQVNYGNQDKSLFTVNTEVPHVIGIYKSTTGNVYGIGWTASGGVVTTAAFSSAPTNFVGMTLGAVRKYSGGISVYSSGTYWVAAIMLNTALSDAQAQELAKAMGALARGSNIV